MRRLMFLKGFLSASVLVGVGFALFFHFVEEPCVPPHPLPHPECGQSPLDREVPIDIAKQSVTLMGKFTGMVDNLAKSSNNPTIEAIHNLYWRFLPNAFTIPKEDLQDVIDCKDCPPDKDGNDVDGARVYTAIRCGMVHLFMVPVEINDGDTLDIIPRTNPSDSNSRYVYNFIHPCPSTCDKASALQIAHKDGFNHPFEPCDIIKDPCESCQNWSTSSNSTYK